ncbi:TPA: hypothetical protein ACKL5Y_001385 [Neisseria gonorrhoeae]
MNQFGVQFQRKIGKMGKKQCGQGDECRTCQKEQKGDAFARQAAGLADFAGEAAGGMWRSWYVVRRFRRHFMYAV